MIKSSVGHIQFNIDPRNIAFYKEFLGFVGWVVVYEEHNILGVGNGQGASLWFSSVTKKVDNDYDGPGMNHLGIAVETQEEVDQVVSYLREHEIKPLFDTPRHRPEFCPGPGHTFYQVMFETPDRILLEVVYTGPIAK